MGLVVLLGVAIAASERSDSLGSKPPEVDMLANFRGEKLLGTRGPERLAGTDSAEMLFAFGGDDIVVGYGGSDLIDPGNGEDLVDAGPGGDRVRAFDGYRDRIDCGPDDDYAFVDPFDVTIDCEETYESADSSPPATPDPPGSGEVVHGSTNPTPDRGTVVLENEAWECRGPVDMDLVKVTIPRRSTPLDAISLGENCTGRIGRVEIDTWSGDGIKVQNAGTVAHDLVIESGYVRCYDRTGEYHQDGIHVMGGYRLTFRQLTVFCGRPGVNGNLFIARGGDEASTPTDIVFEHGHLGPDASHTILLADAIRSGARDTILCPGRNATFRIQSTALSPVDVRNVRPGGGGATCRDR